MKKMVLSAVALIGFTVASYGANHVEEVYKDVDVTNLLDSCTITTGTLIESNGEAVYQEITVFHTDAYSCEYFFCM